MRTTGTKRVCLSVLVALCPALAQRPPLPGSAATSAASATGLSSGYSMAAAQLLSFVGILTSSEAIRVYGQNHSFTSAGSNHGGVSADSLYFPNGVAVDGSGGLYVADTGNNRVLHYPVGGTTADRVYGQGGSFTSETCNNGGVISTVLCSPEGVAVDGSGGLYVADSGNNRVLHYPAGSTTADRVYGQGGSLTSGDFNHGGLSAASLAAPDAVAVDGSGGLYVGDYWNHRVLYYPIGSATAGRVYGQDGSFTSGIVNLGGSSATSLGVPSGVAVDGNGGLFVADLTNHRVLHYPAGSTTADRVYGQDGSLTSTDYNHGGLSATNLSFPSGIAIDGSGGLYVADSYSDVLSSLNNNRVLHFPSGSTTPDAVYGQGGSFVSGAYNNGGLGAASLAAPSAVAVDGNGGLYIADTSNNRVLYYAPVGASQTVTVPLAAGWNLISMPLAPTTSLDAQTVLTTLLASTHGAYAEIDSYSNGQFAPSLFDDPGDKLGINGTNFALKLGHGFALYTDTAGSLTVTGTPVTAATAISLAAGWNLVGFPDAGTTSYKAYDVLSNLLAATQGGYAEIDSYANGQFNPSAFDDPGDELGLNGSNFTIQPGLGYALYTDTGMPLSL